MIEGLLSPIEAVNRFLEMGGPVLWGILLLAVLLWSLLLERAFWMLDGWRQLEKELIRRRDAAHAQSGWIARQIKEQIRSFAGRQITRRQRMIRTLVALSPLFGLLGTVTGMIEVFDVMAASGTGNPRAMAAGVQVATIPTMAGMVVALSGMLFSGWLDRLTAGRCRLVDRLLTEE